MLAPLAQAQQRRTPLPHPPPEPMVTLLEHVTLDEHDRGGKTPRGEEIEVLLAPSPIPYANRGRSGGEARHSSDGPTESTSTLDGRTAVLVTVGLAHRDARRRPNRSRPVHRNLGLGRWVFVPLASSATQASDVAEQGRDASK